MSGKMTATFFAAGKSDAILIQTDGSSVMIDTGLSKNSAELIRELRSRNVRTFDAVILSHYDKDHIGGAPRMLKKFPVRRMIGTYRKEKGNELRQIDKIIAKQEIPFEIYNRDTVFSLDGAVYEIFPASGEYRTSLSNNASLIVSVTFGDVRFLFTGDAEDERIREFLEEHYIRADILKLPYHGFPVRSLGELMQAVQPDICVITNSRRFPPADKISETRYLIEEAEAECLETRNGTVTITTDGRDYRIIR